MIKKKNLLGRAAIVILAAILLSVATYGGIHLASERIYDLYWGQPSDEITDWQFVTADSQDAAASKEDQWKWADSAHPIRDIEGRYIRLRTTLAESEGNSVLLIVTQSELLTVTLDGIEMPVTAIGDDFSHVTKTRTILPEGYDGQTLEIIARTSLDFNFLAGITEDARFIEINEAVRQANITIGLMLVILGGIMSLIALVIAIKLKGIGRVILSGLILAGTGGVYLLTALLPLSAVPSLPFYEKYPIILLMGVLSMIFGTALYVSKRKGILPKLVVAALAAGIVPFLLLRDGPVLNYFVPGYTALIILSAVFFLFVMKSLVAENIFQKKLLYCSFLFAVLCGAFDLLNTAIVIGGGASGLFLLPFLLYAVALFNLAVTEAIHLNVRINERNEQIKRNTQWIERIVSACASIFSKQQLEDFCIQTAVSMKSLIMNDIRENVRFFHNGTPMEIEEPSVSIAIKKDNSFAEIYNQGGILDCRYEMLEQKFSNRKQPGVAFGGSYLVIPLFVSEKLAAIIYYEGIRPGISENLKNIIMTAYANISIALDNLKLKSDIVETQQSVFTYLAEMSEAKSEETGFHVKRVSEFVRALCEALNMDAHEVEVVTKASMMHDVGKLAVPEELIKKKGDLSPSEYETVKQHVIYGHNMLAKSQGEFMEAAATIAQQHHEKWNGEGYLGLVGDQIHLYARITAVADVFDALMSKRSYKDAWTVNQACGFILEKSGSHFDPMVSAAFARCMDRMIQIKNENPD